MATPKADPADLVYDLQVSCCGRVWRVHRANTVTKRVEQAFGPIYPLSLRLRSLALTSGELARLIQVLIEDQRGAPELPAIEAWVFNHGAARLAPALAGEVLTLIAGNEAVAEMQRDKGEGGASPFARAAG